MKIIILCRKYVRRIMLYVNYLIMAHIYKMNIACDSRISWGAKLDRTYPKGIFIDRESYVASGSIILSHDFCRNAHMNTHIGKRCFIGANSIILPGVKLGDSVIVGAGSVVTKNISSGCIVAGNPARVIREGIHTKKWGQLTCDHSNIVPLKE